MSSLSSLHALPRVPSHYSSSTDVAPTLSPSSVAVAARDFMSALVMLQAVAARDFMSALVMLQAVAARDFMSALVMLQAVFSVLPSVVGSVWSDLFHILAQSGPF